VAVHLWHLRGGRLKKATCVKLAHDRYSNGTAIVVKDYGLLVRFSSTVSGHQSYLQLTDPPTESLGK